MDLSPRVDRRLLVGGAGLTGVVLGWVLLVTVFGGQSDDGAVVPPPRPAVVAQSEPAPPSTPPALDPATILAGRDPFRQLVTVPKSPAAGQTVTASQAPTGGQAATTALAAPSAPSATPTTVPARAAGDTAALELKSIVQDAAGVTRANITVDGQSFSPAAGELFSHGYRLDRIDGTCVEVSAQGTKAQMCVAPAKP